MKLTWRRIAALAAKDLRRALPHLAVTLPALGIFTLNDFEGLTRRGSLTGFAARLAYMVTVLALGHLVAVLVQDDGPSGSHPYWATRPFEWQHVVTAKVCTVVVTVNLPLFLLQAAACAYHGISPFEVAGDLAVRQLFFTAYILLPAAALAALTRTIGQTSLVGIGSGLPLLVTFAFVNGDGRSTLWPGGMLWILTTEIGVILLAGMCAVVLLQYARRPAWMARMVFGATIMAATVAMLIPIDGLARPRGPDPGIGIALDRSGAHAPSTAASQFGVRVELPLTISQAPPETSLALESSRIEIVNGAGTKIPFGVTELRDSGSGGASLGLTFYGNEFREATAGNATVRGRLTIVLLRRSTLPETHGDPMRIPGFGVWSAEHGVCYSEHARVRLPQFWVTVLDDPIPATVALSPIKRWECAGHGDVSIDTPIGRFERTIEFRDLDLREYAGPI